MPIIFFCFLTSSSFWKKITRLNFNKHQPNWKNKFGHFISMLICHVISSRDLPCHMYWFYFCSFFMSYRFVICHVIGMPFFIYLSLTCDGLRSQRVELERGKEATVFGRREEKRGLKWACEWEIWDRMKKTRGWRDEQKGKLKLNRSC